MGISRADSHSINITPLIDILLVLLIIFLVMMPIMLRSETVVLPPHEDNTVSEVRPIELKLAADLSVALDDGPVFPGSELPRQLRGKLGKTSAVFIDAVDGVPWHEIVSTVDTVRGVASGASRDDVVVAVRLRGE